MVLLVYLAVFATVFFFRYRSLSGANLSLQTDANGQTYYESQNRVSKKSVNLNIRLGLPVEEKLFFKITPEGRLSRLLKAIGVAEEFQTGAQRTDALLFVSDDPALFEGLMQSPQVRSALESLDGQHVKIRLRAFGHRLWLEADNVLPGWLEKNRQTILTHLWEIASAAQKQAQMSAQAAPRLSYAQRAALFMVMHATFLTGGIAGFFAHAASDIDMLDMTRFLMATLALVPLAAGIWIILMTAVLRRSMWLVVSLGDFLVIGLAGLALSVPLLSLELNRRLPQAPAVMHSQPLLNKSCSVHCSRKRGKSTTTRDHDLSPAECRPGARDAKLQSLKQSDSICSHSARLRYKMHFANWQTGENEPYRVDADAAFFDSGKTGDLYDIPVHPGALGHSWVDQEEIRRSHAEH